MYIYPTPTPRVGCDTSLILKRNTADLNSELSFSLIGYLIKTKEPSQPYNLPIAGSGEKHGFMIS